ncbi:MAG: hypothetical protein AAF715_13395 [Myxococcota bacterium]
MTAAVPNGTGMTSSDLAQATRIARLAALLSLDATRPFLARLTRLDVDPEAFCTSLRTLIVEVRREAEEAKRAPMDFEARWRAVVAQEHGEATVASLWWFIANVYFIDWADRPQWNGWHLAFKIATHRPIEKRAFANALGAAQREVFDAFDALERAEELHNQIDAVRQISATDWDLDIYARRSWDPESDTSPPFREIRDVVSLWAFRDVMGSIVGAVDDDGQAQLTALANGLLDELGAYRPHPLVSPQAMMGVLSS